MPKNEKSKNNFLRMLKVLLFSFEKISVLLLRFAYVVVTLAYLCAVSAILLKDVVFPDVSTALYWSGELLNLGKELLGATVVPVLLFELFLIVSGRKQPDRQIRENEKTDEK